MPILLAKQAKSNNANFSLIKPTETKEHCNY
jgi:hypothetical protein